MVKIKINRDLCIGSAACVAACPEIFYLDNDGKVALKSDNVDENKDPELAEKVKDAAQSCPTGVISLE
ncbi:ferredoxin [Nanobdella aerobiophila]|uniref:Ferredoxin n=1 Tax=Nanobdella aerobiophila TaxID=2586965 RepID=A0A915WT45_9ARCH|nr:ferredoxin [Nanobdella aerobiophila]BBL45852.1 ferredoxin [Nanobdella aerobiophila]